MSFDAISYFESREIEVHYPGEKNVSTDWIEIKCPFPLCGDPSWHCGISPDTEFFKCWKCGEKGHITKLIKELEHCSWIGAKLILDQFQDTSFGEPKRRIQIGSEECTLPKEATLDIPNLHRKYLRQRNFDPVAVATNYHLKFCYNIGNWRFRIIAPIFVDRDLVCFTSLDVTGLAKVKYKHCPNEQAVTPAKYCAYNIDTVKDVVVITEGITDVWRFGSGSVATLGIQFTRDQFNLLVFNSSIKSVFIMFDSDLQAVEQAYKLANWFRDIPHIDHTEVIELSEGDPADLSEKDVLHLRREIGLE